MEKIYEYTGINDSSTMSVLMGAAITEAQGKAVSFSDGKAVLPKAGEIPAGILLISNDATLKEGAEATIQVKNIGLWKAGAAFSAGDMLATDAEGLCQKATSGQFMYAKALEDASAKGDVIQMQIVHAGYEQ